MASEESIHNAPIPSVKAICTKNNDPWRQNSCDELQVGESYTPDYFVIGRSWSYLCIKEFPENEYNTVMFDYQVDDGRHLDFHKDIIRPVMERYRDYLYNEMNLTGTWEVYVKMNDDPITPVSEKNQYRIIRYGCFELEKTRNAAKSEL